jgi:hypothetical protein
VEDVVEAGIVARDEPSAVVLVVNEDTEDTLELTQCDLRPGCFEPGGKSGGTLRTRRMARQVEMSPPADRKPAVFPDMKALRSQKAGA